MKKVNWNCIASVQKYSNSFLSIENNLWLSPCDTWWQKTCIKALGKVNSKLGAGLENRSVMSHYWGLGTHGWQGWRSSCPWLLSAATRCQCWSTAVTEVKGLWGSVTHNLYSFLDCSCPFPSGCKCCYFSSSLANNSAFGNCIWKLSYRVLQLPCKLREIKHLLLSALLSWRHLLWRGNCHGLPLLCTAADRNALQR